MLRDQVDRGAAGTQGDRLCGPTVVSERPELRVSLRPGARRVAKREIVPFVEERSAAVVGVIGGDH